MNTFDSDLLDASREIGGIGECNGIYFDSLVRRLTKEGKPVADFTVGELMAIHREHNTWWNVITGRDEG